MKPYLSTTVGIVFLLLSAWPLFGGFVVFFFMIIIIPVLAVNLIRAKLKQRPLTVLKVKSMLWIMAFLIVTGHHILLAHKIRQEAENVAAALDKYHEQTGHYPASLTTLGFDEESEKNLGISYWKENDAVSLIYLDNWKIYNSYIYNFGTEKWAYISD